jgi:hypothetical protein
MDGIAYYSPQGKVGPQIEPNKTTFSESASMRSLSTCDPKILINPKESANDYIVI